MTFLLHAQLQQDTFAVATLDVCQLLLMNDARYPWLILVPQIADLTDLHQVPTQFSQQLFAEINAASTALETLCNPFKLNVAALGNQVPQLHIHVIARTQSDLAWPGPVWGVGSAEPYADDAAKRLISALQDILVNPV